MTPKTRAARSLPLLALLFAVSSLLPACGQQADECECAGGAADAATTGGAPSGGGAVGGSAPPSGGEAPGSGGGSDATGGSVGSGGSDGSGGSGGARTGGGGGGGAVDPCADMPGCPADSGAAGAPVPPDGGPAAGGGGAIAPDAGPSQGGHPDLGVGGAAAGGAPDASPRCEPACGGTEGQGGAPVSAGGAPVSAGGAHGDGGFPADDARVPDPDDARAPSADAPSAVADAALPEPDAAAPPAIDAPRLPPGLPAAQAPILRAISDTEWGPALEVPPAVPDRGPEPPMSLYGRLPEGWAEQARARYSLDNTLKSIMTLGDSISESNAFITESQWDDASGVARSAGYVHLSKDLSAMAGQESVWGALIVEDALNAGLPETMTVLFGTNDARHGYELPAFIEHMRTIVEASIAHGTLPILLTPPPLHGSVETVAELAATVTALADEYQVPLFDFQAFLVDRGQLDLDLPDGIHPSYDAYLAFNTEWIRFYKHIEWHALDPMRPQAPPADPLAEDRAIVWTRVFDRSFRGPDDLADLEVGQGRWEVLTGPAGRDELAATALSGRSATDDFALLRLPVNVAGPVRVHIVATSDGAEISVVTNNAGDPWGVDGWYFGFGTNMGARTGIVFQDNLVAELPGVAPVAAQWSRIRVSHTPNLVRWGLDGTYRLNYGLQGEVTGPANNQVGLYVWNGTVNILRVVVWAGQAP